MPSVRGAVARSSRRRGDLLDATQRRRLRARSFSIVSDDCWGGELYRAVSLPYQTPFIGLLIAAPDFVQLASDPVRWLDAKIRFGLPTRYPGAGEEEGTDFPIGHLDGELEVKFLHYGSEHDAAETWYRRRDRIDLDRLLFKFSGDTKHYPVPEECLVDFDALPVRGVCFTSRPRPDLSKAVHVPHWSTDGAKMYRRSLSTFDPIDWVNGGDGRPSRATRAANRLLNPDRRDRSSPRRS